MVTVAVMNFWRVYLAVKWIGKRFIEWERYIQFICCFLKGKQRDVVKW